ncbi:MAG: OsmC family protein [Ferruginibacter sp.]
MTQHKSHHYKCTVEWTGNKGEGTKSYTAYSRNHLIVIDGKETLEGSSDAAFRGDSTLYNPEDLLLASLSACHMLWYLHVCADAGIIVTAYEDHASGTMEERPDGGRFTEVVLHPKVTITDATRLTEANDLHAKAHKNCFIANSCNFPVRHEPSCMAAE